MEKKSIYWNPYVAGVALGVTMFLSYYLVGNGLGASGALQRFVAWGLNIFSPEYVASDAFWGHYFGGEKGIFNNWLVFEVLGVLAGGFLSGLLAGRVKFTTEHGPRWTKPKRWAMALLGGMIMGYGARLARGCTSGQALSGGAVLSAGSWVFMIMIFVAAYAMAYFVRKQWT